MTELINDGLLPGTTPLLSAERLAAAELSGGISSGPIYSAAIAAALGTKPDAAAILDYGSGVGNFLAPLASAFPHAMLHAVDIMERPLSLAPHVIWHRGDLNEELPIEERFDLICAIEVIEHLENPRHILREIAKLLNSNGVALLTTPNIQSLRSLISFSVRGHHAGFDDSNYPAHITPVSIIDIKRAGAEAGLALEKVFYTDDGMIPKFLSRRWQRLPFLGHLLRGQLYSDNIGVTLRKP